MSAFTTAQRTAILASAEAGILDSKLLDAILGNAPTVPAAKPAAPKAPKASRKQTTQPKAATIAPQRKTAKPQTARSLDTTPGSITNGQRKRITAVSDQNGFEILDMAAWSMATASTYYNDLKAAI